MLPQWETELGPVPASLNRVLYASVFLIATCGLIYELLAGALSSYLLGDTVTQFSLIIGVYLSSMGVGSYLSRYLHQSLLERFIEIELAVALLGGFQAPLLFAGFAWTPAFRVVLFVLVGLIGAGVGLELPLLIRILERDNTLKELVARVLFLDYIGALAASLLFPLFLLPNLGLLRTSLVIGLINAGVALWTAISFEASSGKKAVCIGAIALLLGGIAGAQSMEQKLESALFAAPVVMSVQSPYQRLVVTRENLDTRLFIDGALQFSSMDEYRYHEALVHVPVAALKEAPKKALILGGGDGLAARELLTYPELQEIMLVDLDPAMTELFSREPLSSLNNSALLNPKVQIRNEDAFVWVRTSTDTGFDVVIIDFPDPNNYGLGKLYTDAFFRLLKQKMSPDGVFSIQSTSPIFSPAAFACVVATVASVGWVATPYHSYVPSFGEWGFVLATTTPPQFRPLPQGLRSFNDQSLDLLLRFPPDLEPKNGEINRLDNQVLVQRYTEDWYASP